MTLLSSSGLTSTPTSSTVSGPSDLTKPYVSDVLSKGSALVNNPPPAYTGDLTAGTSDYQNEAWKGLSNLTLPSTMTTAGQNLLDLGNQNKGITYNAVGSDFNTANANQYMNPFLSAALNPVLEEQRRQSQIDTNASLGRAAMQGAFGGGRQAITQAEGTRNLGMLQNKTLTEGYKNAYDEAQKQFNADQARKIQEAQYGTDTGLKALSQATTANQAAGNVGAQEAQYGLQNLQALSTAGNTQQAQNQAALNAKYNQYLDQRNMPSTLLKNQADLIKSIGGNTSNVFNAKPSDLQSAVGVAGNAAQLIANLKATGKDLPTINSILKSIGINPDTLKSQMPAIDPSQVPSGYSLSPDGTYVTDASGGRFTVDASGKPVPMFTGADESSTVVGPADPNLNDPGVQNTDWANNFNDNLNNDNTNVP